MTLLEKIETILQGIDATETGSPFGEGWWETSTGAAFGAKKLEEIRAAFAAEQKQPEIVRVLRVLEYVGPRAAVERTLAANAVKGERRVSDDFVIREGVIGQYPEVLKP